MKKGFNDPEMNFAEGTGIYSLQDCAADRGLLAELSEDDWRALLEAALPEIQELIDGDDEFPDMKARELVDGLSDSDQDDTGDQLIKHRIKQAANQLRNLKDEVEQTTPQKVAERLSDHPNVGSGPYEGYWVDFIQEYSNEIILELITDLETEIEYVEDMLETSTATSNSEREEMNSEELRNLLEMEVDELDLSIRSHNCLKAANIQTVGELVQLEEGEMLRFRNFGRESLRGLKEALSAFGLEFGMDVDELLEDE